METCVTPLTGSCGGRRRAVASLTQTPHGAAPDPGSACRRTVLRSGLISVTFDCRWSRLPVGVPGGCGEAAGHVRWSVQSRTRRAAVARGQALTRSEGSPSCRPGNSWPAPPARILWPLTVWCPARTARTVGTDGEGRAASLVEKRPHMPLPGLTGVIRGEAGGICPTRGRDPAGRSARSRLARFRHRSHRRSRRAPEARRTPPGW